MRGSTQDRTCPFVSDEKQFAGCVALWLRGRDMRKQDIGFDYHRYHRLLLEADDESKRLALIELLIEEKARDRLAAQRASDRAAMTAHTIATVLKNGRN
jgi:hypothetical protein